MGCCWCWLGVRLLRAALLLSWLQFALCLRILVVWFCVLVLICCCCLGFCFGGITLVVVVRGLCCICFGLVV